MASTLDRFVLRRQHNAEGHGLPRAFGRCARQRLRLRRMAHTLMVFTVASLNAGSSTKGSSPMPRRPSQRACHQHASCRRMHPAIDQVGGDGHLTASRDCTRT